MGRSIFHSESYRYRVTIVNGSTCMQLRTQLCANLKPFVSAKKIIGRYELSTQTGAQLRWGALSE